jgi:hypothetical protein
MADESKAAFTPEQLESLNSLMGSTVNNILTARLKTTEKQLLEKTSTSIADALKAQLPDLLKELRPALETEGKEGKEGKGSRRADEVVELATMRKQIEELNKSNATATERARAADARRFEMERQRWLGEKLAAIGVADPFKQELAIAYLDKKKRVVWSGEEEDRALLWNDDGGNQVSGDEGFASWAKSEEVKHFLPASGAKGAGSGPVRGTPIAGGKPTKEQAWEVVGTSLKEAFQNST